MPDAAKIIGGVAAAAIIIAALTLIVITYTKQIEIGQKVDGGWTEYTESACTKECGGGIKTRSRTCTNPVPQNGGATCLGPSTEVVECNTQPCVISGTVSLNPGSSTSVALNPVSSTTVSVNPGSSTTVTPISVNGGWSAWVNEGSCVSGSQQQKRTCTNPSPLNGGAQCEGSATQIVPCPVDGGLTGWIDLVKCDKECGGGVKKLSRYCTNPSPANGGRFCEGPFVKDVACNTEPCPIDGGWTTWTDGGACSKTCGGGTRMQTRTCTNPAPQFGGRACIGSDTQITDCNTQPCPVDGGFTDWKDEGICSKPCDGGLQQQSRTCTNPTPSHGGAPCSGALGQSVPCNTGSCWYKMQDQRFTDNCLYAASIGTSGDLNSRTRWMPCSEADESTFWQFQDVGSGKALVKNKGVNGCLKRPQNSTKLSVVPCDTADTYQHFRHNVNGTLENQGVLPTDTYPLYRSAVNKSYTRPPVLRVTPLDVWSSDDNAEKFNKITPKMF